MKTAQPKATENAFGVREQEEKLYLGMIKVLGVIT